MKNKKAVSLIVLLFIALIAYIYAINERTILGRSYAKQELKDALAGTAEHNVIDNERIILIDEATAINVAEPILFSIYGKENITKQRPYESYLIDNYWIISGTLPKSSLGGTFLIIIDSRNCRILKITHGK